MSKYHNKKVKIDNIWFDSKREANYYNNLKLLKASNYITDFELQPIFELQPSYKKEGKTVRAIKYIADFKVTHPDGQVDIIDVKGFRTEIYKIKKKLFHFKYPELTIEEV